MKIKTKVENVTFKAWTEKGEALTDYACAYLYSSGELYLIDDNMKRIENAVIELEVKNVYS